MLITGHWRVSGYLPPKKELLRTTETYTAEDSSAAAGLSEGRIDLLVRRITQSP